MENTLEIEKVKKGYKKTPVGLIPKEWEVKKLGSLGEILSGLTYSPSDIDINGTLVLRSSNVKDRQIELLDNVYVRIEDVKFNPVQEGDILICVRNGSRSLIGKNAIITKDVSGSSFGAFMAIYRSNINSYLYQIFDTDIYQKEIHKNIGATINSINGSDFKKFSVPIPPENERLKIVSILSTWDEAIAATKTLIVQTKKRNQGLAQQLLTGKTRLKGFKGKFVELKADKIFKNNTDKTHNGNLEILSATQDRGVIPRSMGNIDIKYDESSLGTYKKVEVGDYVISLRSFQGGIEYSEYEGIVSPAYTILKEIIPVSKTFYKVYFKTETFINRLNTIIYGIRDGKQISFKDFATLKLPYPSIEEQEAIAKILETANKELKTLEQKLKCLEAQKKGLMQKLLTGEIRVK